jgi:uncharacterized spore protein YtfJ
MDALEFIEQARDSLTVRRVFGDPYTVDGVTLVPAARILGGGGGGGAGPEEGGTAPAGVGGGYGMRAVPAGAYVIRNGEVSWQPAVDVTRIALGGQVVAVVLLLVVRSALRRRRRRRPT